MSEHVQGEINHDAVDAGDPVKIGARAVNQDGTTPTTVAEDDRSNLRCDLGGSLFVNIGHPRYFHTITGYAAAQTNAEVVAAPGAGLSIYLTDVVVTSNTVTSFDVVGTTAVPITVTSLFVASGGGTADHQFRNALKLAVNTNLGITTDASATTVNFCGWIGP